MTNRDKLIEMIEVTFGVKPIKETIYNEFKGCNHINCPTGVVEETGELDCDNCPMHHFWYKEYEEKETELSRFKKILQQRTEEECYRTNANGEYVYSEDDVRIIGNIEEVIFNITL